jgi:hypothetical protein
VREKETFPEASHMSEESRESKRAQRVAGKFINAVDRAVDALEELKKARIALSLEANRPPLKIKTADKEGANNED